MSNYNAKRETINYTLCFFQGIASILVIFLHVPLPGIVGVFVESLGRIAVPLFYMVSGYTLYNTVETPEYRAKVRSRLKKNLRVTIGALLLYFVVDVVKCIIQKESIGSFFLGLLSKESILKFFIVGIISEGSGGVLWFMIGLVYVYLIRIVLPIKRRSVYRNALISFALMMILNVCKIYFTYNRTYIIGLDLSTYWLYGNWATIGITSVNIGLVMAKLVEDYSAKMPQLRRICIPIIIGSAVLNFAFYYALKMKLDMYLSYTLFTLVIDGAIFLLSTCDNISPKNIVARLGQYHSRNRYLYHCIFIFAANFAITYLGNLEDFWVALVKPISVILMTVVFSICLNKAKMIFSEKANRGGIA